MIFDAQEKAIRQRLKDDFIHYASKCLRIRTKSGSVEPFLLNKAQLYIHEQLEKQKGETGKVRALVLKGRQQGVSTLIGGRFYHKVSHHFGMQAFILTHALDATQNLYKMAQRYYENTPVPVKPQVTTSNSKELIFGLLDSGYKLGTAENKAVGRSATIQLLHSSEVAFWNNAAEHAKGIMQAVPNSPGTEIIMESTANGVGNFFHQQWQQAEAGQSDYIAIFVPWFWQTEYAVKVDGSFSTTSAEDELMFQHGLTVEQIAWRRLKITEFSVNGMDGEKAFKQEYPCIVGSQRVGTNSGIIPIQEVIASDITNTGMVNQSWYSGNKETIEIVTTLGYSLECTLDHRIAIAIGFTEANKSLNETIKLAIPKLSSNYYFISWNPMPCVSSRIYIDEDWGLFLGYFMGDGSYSDATLSFAFTKTDVESIATVEHLILKLFGLTTAKRETSVNGIEVRVGCKALKPIFEELVIITNKNGVAKRKVCIPECIWRSPEPVVSNFLKGLFDADGFAAIYAAGVRFFSKHEQFAKDVQLLLLAFGITCRRMHIQKKNSKGHIYMGSELSLRGNESRLYRDKIGFISQRKIDRMAQWNVRKNTGSLSIPLLYQDQVIAINPKGYQDVYDLELNNSEHVFDAQGILVHNCTSVEAFQTTGEDTYISSELIMKARKCEAEKYGKLVIGVDPARFGDDRTAIIRRQGRVAYNLETHIKKDTMEVVGIVNTIIEQEKPFKVFVDVGGLGAGVVDRLKELGHRDIVVAVNAGSSALDARKYYNKRAEMWAMYKQWLLDEPCQIPDSNELHADSCGIRYKVDSNSRLVMEQKAEMKKRGIRSCDTSDSLCLTFALPDSALHDSHTNSKIASKVLSSQKSALRARSNLYGSQQNS